MNGGSVVAEITGLYIYPVKSCRGISLTDSRILERGLQHDREWLLIDQQGHFLSQRKYPRLALITPQLSHDELLLTAQGFGSLSIPLEFPGGERAVTIWQDTVTAIDAGDQAAAWFSSFLSADVRLVRFDPRVRRPCKPYYVGGNTAHTAFADGYPFLLISEASLADLNSRLDDRLPMNRFRPNLVLSGVEAFEEDYMDTISTDSVSIKLVKPCTRCQITTTDQETGEINAEPLITLARYRNQLEYGGVTFGMNAILLAGAGSSIRVGQQMEAILRF